MKKLLGIAFLIQMVMLVLLFLMPEHLAAQTANFGGVVPFSTPAGRLGLFNQNNGKIYIYDANLQNCVYIGQVEQLGQPIARQKFETGGAYKN